MPESFSPKHIERFTSLYSVTDTCWIWNGSHTIQGYGRMFADGKNHYAHRIAYLLHNGKLTDGLVLDHTCRNRTCVNPQHLEEVTLSENVKRGGNAKTKCKNGHKFTDENTYIKPNGNRNCKTCRLDSTRRYRYATA